MTNEMKYLMYLYAHGAQGVSANPPIEDINWYKLFEIANEQTVINVLAYSIKISGELGCPDELKFKANSVLLGTTLKNQLHYEKVFELIKEFESCGLKPVILKGIDSARFYNRPECRISADTDILIDEESEEAMLEIFEHKGFEISRREKTVHHSGCRSEIYGFFELHTMLWEKKIGKLIFGIDKGKTVFTEDKQRIKLKYGECTVLGSTDAFLFMSMHMIKHFIISGIGLRTIYDVVLYASENIDTINYEHFWDVITMSGYRELMNVVLSFAVKYFGFSKNDFPGMECVSDEKISLLADDIETGGFQGEKDMDNRKDAWRLLMNHREKEKYGKIRYKLRTALRITWVALAPKYSTLEMHYPYLAQNKWLYPVAWVSRLFSESSKSFHGKGKVENLTGIADAGKISKEGSERLKMFRKMQIM